MTHTTPRTGQQMIDKPITVEDYDAVADEFFAKYHFVAKELGEGAKAEDILKIMENLTGLALVMTTAKLRHPGFSITTLKPYVRPWAICIPPSTRTRSKPSGASCIPSRGPTSIAS